MTNQIPTYKDVVAAAKSIKGHAIRTPLLRFDALDEATGCRVFVKPENLQRTGSFKFRGAYNAISNLSDEQRAKGVLASSSGNHAQGVGAASRIFGCDATIIMPADAPEMKIERTKALGANVVLYDREKQDRDQILKQLEEETGSIVVHPYNNQMVIAGQGTVGLEIAEDLQTMDIQLDRMVVCTGGGGHTAGIALAMHHHFPNTKIHASEPDGFDDYKRSLDSGQIVSNDKTAGSICDAILTPSPGVLGFEINRRLLHSGLVITDEEALAAVKFAFEELKLVVEPGGAAALASVLKYSKEWGGDCIALTLSGGNIGSDVFTRAIST